MKLTHLYAVCACALLSLGAVNADNAYAQKAPAKKEAAAAHKNAPVPVDRIAAVVNHDVITEIQLQQRFIRWLRIFAEETFRCPDGQPSRPDA
ncbi:MAG: hypothetical protein ACLRW2_04005 [Parasutterella excrementihominis]